MAKKRFKPGNSMQVQFAEFRKEAQQMLQMLTSEFARRSRDPYENNFMGVLQSADPLAREKGQSPYDLYSDLLRDFAVFSNYQKRTLTVISKPWQITPVEKSEKGTQDAAIVTEILKRCRFDQVFKDLLDALIIGISYSEIIWTIRDGYIVPDRIVKRAQKRFIFKDVENKPPELRLITKEKINEGVCVPAHKFIVHRHGSIDDNPYGQGIGLQLYWLVYFKRANMVSWNKLNDRYGTPIPWGKYAPNATQEAKSTLFDALKAFSSDGVIMTPDTTTIQLLEAALSGNITSHQTLANYLDNAIAGVLTGETGAENSGGALAAASVERRDVIKDLGQGDSDLLCDTLNETLIKWICEFNGLELCQVYRPVKEETDLKATAETWGAVYALGFKPRLDMVRSEFGEGWELRTDMNQQPYYNISQPYAQANSNTAMLPNFAEAQVTKATNKTEQALIDDAASNIKPDDFDDIMQGILQPLLAAIEDSANYEDALKKAQAALPKVDTERLESALSKVMFGAQVVGHGIKQTEKTERG